MTGVRGRLRGRRAGVGVRCRAVPVRSPRRRTPSSTLHHRLLLHHLHLLLTPVLPRVCVLLMMGEPGFFFLPTRFFSLFFDGAFDLSSG